MGQLKPCAFISDEGKRCPKLALSLSEFCWEHLGDRDSYIRKIKRQACTKSGLERFQLQEVQLPGIDFERVNLKEANLEDANLEHSNLRETQLQEANLRGANLQNANLHRANLRKANLQEANLSGAHLQETQLDEANLQGAILREANLHGSLMPFANLSEADLWRANLFDARLWDANLEGVNFQQARLQEARMRRANLRRANLETANLQGASLIDCDLRDANLYQADLSRANLSGAIIGDRIIQEKQGEFLKAKAIYRSLKDNFRQSGLYEESGEMFYREMTVQRKTYWQFYKFYGNSAPQSDLGGWRRFFDFQYQLKLTKFVFRYRIAYLWSWLVNVICGYGERPLNVFGCAAFVVTFFALIYIFLPFLNLSTDTSVLLSGLWCHRTGTLVTLNFSAPLWENLQSFGNALYCSVITFLTVGYGDITPLGFAKGFAMFEGFIGGFMMAVFVMTFGRKMMR